jgi:hypothetical protein
MVSLTHPEVLVSQRFTYTLNELEIFDVALPLTDNFWPRAGQSAYPMLNFDAVYLIESLKSKCYGVHLTRGIFVWFIRLKPIE